MKVPLPDTFRRVHRLLAVHHLLLRRLPLVLLVLLVAFARVLRLDGPVVEPMFFFFLQ